MEFLGKHLKEEVLNKIVYNTSFDVTKTNPTTNCISDVKMNRLPSLCVSKGGVCMFFVCPLIIEKTLPIHEMLSNTQAQ